jgi:hypothetical protein
VSAADAMPTAGEVVALVARQIEVSGVRPVLTDASRQAAERAAEQLLDSLSGERTTPLRHANGAEHDSD